MMRNIVAAVVAAGCLAREAPAQQSVTQQLQALETRWNEAHVTGDTAELLRQWDDGITFIVPGMRKFSKADIVAFWKSGSPKVMRYETSDVTIRPYGDAAIVEGRVRRTRDFNGQIIEDDWRFTKTYVRRDGQWRVVSWHASVMPPQR